MEGKPYPLRLPKDFVPLGANAVTKMIAILPNGVEFTPADVQIWFASKLPHMEMRGRKDMTATARNWWARLKPGEVNESKTWLRSVNAKASAKIIGAQLELEAKTAVEFTPEQIADAENGF